VPKIPDRKRAGRDFEAGKGTGVRERFVGDEGLSRGVAMVCGGEKGRGRVRRIGGGREGKY